MEKDQPKRPSHHQLQEDCKRAIPPAAEESMSPYTWRRQGPTTQQLLHLHAQPSPGQSCHRQKRKSFAPMHAGLLQSCPTLCDPVDSGLPGFSVRGVLQARILERIGQYWLPYPSRALYILLPELPTPLSTWSFKNPCNPSSCTTSTPGPHRGKPKSSRAGSAANPSGRLTYRGGNKTTVETQGQCG